MKGLVLLLALLCMLYGGALAQTRRDPLTSLEVDQMRDSAPDSKRRIGLLLGFAGARLLAVERLLGAVHPDPRDVAKAEELLGDFALLIDELDDNLAMYSKHGEDLRPQLRRVLDAEAGFQPRLKAIADHAAEPQTTGVETHSTDPHGMAAALEEASDSLQSSSESANAMLAAENLKRGGLRGEKKP